MMISFLKKILTASLILGAATFTLTACGENSPGKKVGMIVPIEHQAMTEIVNGFKTELQKTSRQPLQFKVANAQGDINLQRSIIQQMKDEGYDLIVPIGTDATQMTLAMTHAQPIVSLAASISEQDRKKIKNCQVAVVHDEISAKQLMQFIHTVYPNIKQIALIHSASEKIFPEVKETVQAGMQLGITIQPKMMQTLSDLYTIANNIPDTTQAIVVLKDSLVVSGIATLEKAAAKRGIPLITSDEGSVENGAALALGVHEKEIGVQGASLAQAVLAGQSPCDLPIKEMKNLTVFVNPDSLQKQGQNLDIIKKAASELHYPIEIVGK